MSATDPCCIARPRHADEAKLQWRGKIIGPGGSDRARRLELRPDPQGRPYGLNVYFPDHFLQLSRFWPPALWPQSSDTVINAKMLFPQDDQSGLRTCPRKPGALFPDPGGTTPSDAIVPASRTDAPNHSAP